MDVGSVDDTLPRHYGDSVSGWWIFLNKWVSSFFLYDQTLTRMRQIQPVLQSKCIVNDRGLFAAGLRIERQDTGRCKEGSTLSLPSHASPSEFPRRLNLIFNAARYWSIGSKVSIAPGADGTQSTSRRSGASRNLLKSLPLGLKLVVGL